MLIEVVASLSFFFILLTICLCKLSLRWSVFSHIVQVKGLGLGFSEE